LANKVKEKDKELRDRMKEHKESTSDLINSLETLQRRFDSQAQEQKKFASKLAEYKQKYQQAQYQVTTLTAKVNETSAATEDQQKQLQQTREQNRNFQDQLHKHKSSVRTTFHAIFRVLTWILACQTKGPNTRTKGGD
jgi:chromosome segregation ATPase